MVRPSELLSQNIVGQTPYLQIAAYKSLTRKELLIAFVENRYFRAATHHCSSYRKQSRPTPKPFIKPESYETLSNLV